MVAGLIPETEPFEAGHLANEPAMVEAAIDATNQFAGPS